MSRTPWKWQTKLQSVLTELLVPDSESPLILSLETATRAGSVALSRGDVVLSLRAGEAQISHSTKLLQSVEEVLAEAAASLADVQLFAAASGPGSFTGLRIGLATVKSFAATCSRKCAGIPTLAAVAHAAGPSVATLAMIPAGRGEVFVQLFSVDENGTVTPLNEAAHKTPERLLDSLSGLGHLTFAGEGARQHERLLQARAEAEGIRLVEVNEALPPAIEDVEKLWIISRESDALAADIAALAYRLYLNDETIGPEQLRAIYVRLSDAELNAQEP
ncbi:MAG TPA: tRNA (adenosine(37)-N6)-threonylcarbamoyltransferase complex dimerization subunit type 1 TsaB [Pyrinomonadaceae bacterium]|jgi:tRNA threonylcarbamoyladenosine biosynthesis protein TsaB